MLHLIQLSLEGARAVAARTQAGTHIVPGAATTYELAMNAIRAGRSLADEVASRGAGEPVNPDAALAAGRVLPPIDHPDPAHLLVTGTGLSHLGSAEGRDKMRRDLNDPAKQTDSMKMFRMGLQGGKPPRGMPGVQPEWFYKGDGSIVVAPEAPLESPDFALDAGEEPEIVGVYLVAPSGAVCRVGFALGNEFADHVTERQNYLYLAHSKLRPCAIGPELVTGTLPDDIRGISRIRRGNAVAWEKPFLSGETNMSHSVANLEAHHFKYPIFRRPGDVHLHFFGTATLSFSDGFQTMPGDVFEIEAPPFTLPLRNTLRIRKEAWPCVTQL